MILFTPTKHGAGVRLWGTQAELMEFYETVERFWDAKEPALVGSAERQRDDMLASFCYDLRHGFMGMRTVARRHPKDKTPGDYYAVEITWTHILFYMAVLRYNMRNHPCTEQDIQLVSQVEEALRDVIRSYSKPYAHAVLPYLEGAVYCKNPNLFQYMEYINYQHINKVRYSTPKNAFSYLARYMTGSIYDSFEYNDILQRLQRIARSQGCEISQLTYHYDHPPYDFEW